MSPNTLPRRWRQTATSAPDHGGDARADLSGCSDEELVELALRGRAEAFELLMKRHERLVFKVAVSFAREREAALDILQNAFLKAFRGLERFQPGSHFRAWLLRITTNEAISWQRRQRRHQGHLAVDDAPEVSSGDDPNADYERQEQQERLLIGLEELRPRYRSAISMRYFQGMKLREIAEVLDCSENVVKQLLFRGVRALRDTVAAQA